MHNETKMKRFQMYLYKYVVSIRATLVSASLRLSQQLQEHLLYPTHVLFSVIFPLLFFFVLKMAISHFRLVHKHHKKFRSLDECTLFVLTFILISRPQPSMQHGWFQHFPKDGRDRKFSQAPTYDLTRPASTAPTSTFTSFLPVRTSTRPPLGDGGTPPTHSPSKSSSSQPAKLLSSANSQEGLSSLLPIRPLP